MMGSVDLESKFQGLSCQDLLKHGPKWSLAEAVVTSAQGTTHTPRHLPSSRRRISVNAVEIVRAFPEPLIELAPTESMTRTPSFLHGVCHSECVQLLTWN